MQAPPEWCLNSAGSAFVRVCSVHFIFLFYWFLEVFLQKRESSCKVFNEDQRCYYLLLARRNAHTEGMILENLAINHSLVQLYRVYSAFFAGRLGLVSAAE